MERILIDTDPGVDDALAILLALRSSAVEVTAFTTVCGNVPVAQATENLLRILAVLESSGYPPIARGSSEPLVKPLVTAAHVHGADGLGNISGLRDQDNSLLYPCADIPIASESGVDMILEMVSC